MLTYDDHPNYESTASRVCHPACPYSAPVILPVPIPPRRVHFTNGVVVLIRERLVPSVLAGKARSQCPWVLWRGQRARREYPADPRQLLRELLPNECIAPTVSTFLGCLINQGLGFQKGTGGSNSPPVPFIK